MIAKAVQGNRAELPLLTQPVEVLTGSPECSVGGFTRTQTALDTARGAAEFPIYNPSHPGS